MPLALALESTDANILDDLAVFLIAVDVCLEGLMVYGWMLICIMVEHVRVKPSTANR